MTITSEWGEIYMAKDGTLSLFDQPRTRRTDPSTSHAAAARVAPFRSTLRSRILDALVVPRTDDELCLALQLDARRWPSCKTARSALYKDGKVRWTGSERDGMRVWVVKVESVDCRSDAL